MISDSEQKLLLWIAMGDFTDREIRDAIRTIENAGPNEIVRLVGSLRKIAGGGIAPFPSAGRLVENEREKEYEDVIAKVEQLLLIETGLSKTQASTELYRALVKRHGQHSVPVPTKIAFRLWVARACDALSQSEVLYEASRLRNNAVHKRQGRSDWPLRSGDDL